MDGASSPNVPCNLLTNVITDITRDTLTAVKKESHETEASESMAHLLPMSSCYIATMPRENLKVYGYDLETLV